MLNVIYTIKACMLLMYTRLTLGSNSQRHVFYLAIYVACGWVATEIAFFTACTPFSGYWAMPPPNPQCTTLQHYAIIQGCFNISSDTLMLFIPLPLIFRLAMPLKQKIVLVIIFSMGTFVILAAILTKIFNLMNVWDPSYMLWYTRESSVAVYVSNLPMIWPLFREWFPSLKALTPGQKSSLTTRRRTKTFPTAARKHMSSEFGGRRSSENGITTTIIGYGASMEELGSSSENEVDLGNFNPGDSDFTSDAGGIHMRTTVEVSEEHVEKGDLWASSPYGWDVEKLPVQVIEVTDSEYEIQTPKAAYGRYELERGGGREWL